MSTTINKEEIIKFTILMISKGEYGTARVMYDIIGPTNLNDEVQGSQTIMASLFARMYQKPNDYAELMRQVRYLRMMGVSITDKMNICSVFHQSYRLNDSAIALFRKIVVDMGLKDANIKLADTLENYFETIGNDGGLRELVKKTEDLGIW